MKQIEKSYEESLNQWVGGLIHITLQICYDIHCYTICLSGYMNAPEEPALIAIEYGMEYLIHHRHELIMYSRKKSYKTHEIPHQCYFKAGYAEMNKNQEYSNFFHPYCDSDHAIDLTGRRSVTSTVHIFNGNLIDWCAKKNLKPQEAVITQRQGKYAQEC